MTSYIEPFYALLRDLAASLGTTVPQYLEHLNEASAENIVGNIEFSNADGTMVKLHLELEKMPLGAGVRATVFFGLSAHEKEWSHHPDFLKALLLCRVLSEKWLPIAPAVFSDDAMLWQLLLPLDSTTHEPLEAFITAASLFYKTAVKTICDLGFTHQLLVNLKKSDHSSDVVWTMKKWSKQKNERTNAIESHSNAGHYYRLLPPSLEHSGMIAINLGNVLDFIGLHRLFMELLKLNAYTFLNDDYYVGFDDRGGLLLHAFLAPCDEEALTMRVLALLQRAEEVRAFILKMTSNLQAAAMQQVFQTVAHVTDLVLT
ncbi:MAG: hypothetical protein ACH346_07870 [Chthoniobacterales bacterium]